jgi:hypothetical protein
MTTPTTTKTEDFLSVDNPIPGQNYVCLSFVSPEEVILNKNSFFVSHFIKSLVGSFKFSDEPTLEELKAFKDHVTQHLSPEGCDDKYKDFLFAKQEELDKRYYEEHDYQTSIRGLKVRGVYDTLKEAQHRAKEIQRNDRSFNVYIGQVGYWLPWDPQPSKIANQEYLEQGLNDLVHKYQDNQKAKEQHFQENIDYVREQAAKQAEKQRLKNQEEREQEQQQQQHSSTSLNSQSSSIEVVDDNKQEVTTESTIQNTFESVDPWMSRKNEEKKSEE